MINTNIITLLMYSTVLFTIGLIGLALNRKNILIIIMSIEIMLLSVNLNFIIFSVYLDDIVGQIFALFILAVAAAESSIGLSILSQHYKIKGKINLGSIKG